MEQWCVDGRDEVRKRGHSFVPLDAEAGGFLEDLTGGLRGILVRRAAAAPHADQDDGSPKPYATCSVVYSYFNDAGVEVDSSGADGGVLEVVAGAGQVTQGFDELLLSMRRGERVEAWLDPAFAFRDHGFHGSRGSIHAHQPVRLALELLAFENPLTTLLRVERATQLKNDGNARFSAGDVDGAMGLYQRALDRLGRSYEFVGPPEEREVAKARDTDIRCVVLNNIATCWFRRDENAKCLMYVGRVLALQPMHAKALYRRAMVHARRMDFDAALRDLELLQREGLGVRDEVEAAIADVRRRNK